MIKSINLNNKYNSLVYGLILFIALLIASLIFTQKAGAVFNNNAGIPPTYQAWNNGDGGTWNNYLCRNPFDGGVFTGAFSTWWSLPGNSATDIPNYGFVSVPAGSDTSTVQLNMLGNHCTSGMNNAAGGPTGASTIRTPLPENYFQVTTFNLFGVDIFPDNLGLTISGEAAAYKDVDWYRTYAPAIGSPENSFYAPLVGYQVSVSGFNSLAPGNYLVSVYLDKRPVTSFGVSPFLPNNYRCVLPNPVTGVRDLSNSGPSGGNCPSTGEQIYLIFRKEPQPVAPTCSFSNTPINGGFTLNWSTANATSVSISGIGPVGANGPLNVGLTNTAYTLTASGPGGTVNCGTTTEVPVLPSCTSVITLRSGVGVGSVPVGLTFATQVTVNNSNSIAANVSSANYSILAAPAASGYTTNTSGSSTARPEIGAGSNQSYRSNDPENIRVGVPGTYTVEWILVTNLGTVRCTGNIVISIAKIGCVVSGVSNKVGIPFQLNIILTNPNDIPITVTSSRWDAENTSPLTGFGARDSNSGPVDVATGGGTVLTKAPPGITIFSGDLTSTTSGDFRVSWTIETDIPAANPGPCENAGANTAREFPYFRFYGNDVIAGGEFGDSCSMTPGIDVEGNGDFVLGPASQQNYKGAAAELAIFATGQIEKVLPGSQVASRSPLEALSFANDSVVPGTFGGGFNSPLCADDFLAIDTLGFTASGNALNLGSSNGDFVAGTVATPETVTVTGGANISDNKRVQLFVNGNVVISNDDIVYVNANNGSWTSIDSIPLIRIYATGNIFIDKSVTVISGLYVAGGTIYTCSNGNSVYVASDLVDNCNSKLTVYGALVANKVELHRIEGNYGTAEPFPESSGSAQIAESFVFSPELYLALISEASTNTDIKFDSILSLPPAF